MLAKINFWEWVLYHFNLYFQQKNKKIVNKFGQDFNLDRFRKVQLGLDKFGQDQNSDRFRWYRMGSNKFRLVQMNLDMFM